MAQWEALKERSGTGEDKANTSEGVSAPPKALLRNGVWYAGDVRCKDYREALKRAEVERTWAAVKAGGTLTFRAGA